MEKRLVGVLDINSPIKGRFDEIDQEGMEAAAALLCRKGGL